MGDLLESRHMDAKRLFDEALRLPAEGRAALAGQLIASLDASDLEPDREAAWAEEVATRMAAYEKGEVAALPAEQLFEQMRAITSRGSKAP